jgi:hypothetical protein
MLTCGYQALTNQSSPECKAAFEITLPQPPKFDSFAVKPVPALRERTLLRCDGDFWGRATKAALSLTWWPMKDPPERYIAVAINWIAGCFMYGLGIWLSDRKFMPTRIESKTLFTDIPYTIITCAAMFFIFFIMGPEGPLLGWRRFYAVIILLTSSCLAQRLLKQADVIGTSIIFQYFY